VTRYSRRFILQTAIAALPAMLIACGQQAPATSKPAETKPADTAPTQAAAPAAQPAATKPAEAAKPAGTVVTGANIGGAQPTAIPTPAGTETNPMPFKAPTAKASGPVTLTLWHYAGFHNDVMKEIAEEYKGKGDPNVSLEVTAYPNLNDQRRPSRRRWRVPARRQTSSPSSPAPTPSTIWRAAASSR